MPCIDYLLSGTNTNAQRVIVNDDLSSFGSYREANKVSDEKLENDTIESSQNSDDYYQDLEALTEAAYNKKTKEEMAELAAQCAGIYPIEECDTEKGIVF